MPDCLTRFRSDFSPLLIRRATRLLVAYLVLSSLRRCGTNQTARALSSGEYRRFVDRAEVPGLPMAPHPRFQGQEPLGNPGRFRLAASVWLSAVGT